MKKGRNKIKVLVALSGGVDSAVAAALLVKQGYDVTAAYFVNYDEGVGQKSPLGGGRGGLASSCWLPDYRDAVRVAAKLRIPIVKLDFVKEYKAKVLDYMFKEYGLGHTPNPDVLCNKYIKFGVWLDWAMKHGFDYLATGHYARLQSIANSSQPIVKLLESKDKNKDQTYFLHQLSREQLSRTLFPVGDYTKPEVRVMAKKFGLPVAQKQESMGICFVGEVAMKEFLQTKIKPKPGDIVTSDGAIIGQHEGLAFYTIGQRNVGVSSNAPLYVVGKNSKKNELVVGYEDDPLLYAKEVGVTNINWISGQKPKFPLKCMVRLRHRQPLEKCRILKLEAGITIVFERPQRAVTPGQFAVFYKKGECLGGGAIQEELCVKF